jgi:hypothetical protein
MRKPLALRWIVRAALLLAVFPVLAHAHPGHDGHDLTWDFRHLAAHPLATLGWFVALGVSVWALRRFVLKAERVIPNAPSQDPRNR